MKKYAISLCVLCIFAATAATAHAQTITAIDPCSAASPCSLTVAITGQNTTFFQGSSTVTDVWLSKGSSRIDAFSFTGIDANSLSASFDIPADANIGIWDVHVSDSVDGELPVLADGFAVYTYPDLDGDGKVDSKDFAFFSRHWLEGVIPQDMVLIPGGEFQMGDSFGEGGSDERPVHTVRLDSFYMGKYEITNEQYCAFLNWADDNGWITVASGVVCKAGSGTSFPYCYTSASSSYSQIAYSGGVFSVQSKGGRDMSNDPMVMVSWYGAAAYCNWRSQQEGYESCYDIADPNWECDFSKKGYRLATEAEWEYAARGGEHDPYYRFPWGDTISHSQANYYSSSYYSYDISPTRGYHPAWDEIDPYTSPVGSFSANGYDLHDMVGNVWEWCDDWYLSPYYSSSPQTNPTGPTDGSSRVLRGGGWSSDETQCRVADRYDYYQSYRNHRVGFRLVLDLN